jgi:antitoxin component of RelBE/YafQ-DinJ toxin-antitoxin module
MTTITAKTLLTVKTDLSLKKAAQKTAKKIGLPLGTIINGFLRRFIQTKEAYFAESYKPSARLRHSIAEGEKEYADGKYQVAHSIEELKKQLKMK